MFANGPLLIEGVLVLGGAFAWGLWELRSLSKLRQEMERKEREAETRARAAAAAGMPREREP